MLINPSRNACLSNRVFSRNFKTDSVSESFAGKWEYGIPNKGIVLNQADVPLHLLGTFVHISCTFTKWRCFLFMMAHSQSWHTSTCQQLHLQQHYWCTAPSLKKKKYEKTLGLMLLELNNTEWSKIWCHTFFCAYAHFIREAPGNFNIT